MKERIPLIFAYIVKVELVYRSNKISFMQKNGKSLKKHTKRLNKACELFLYSNLIGNTRWKTFFGKIRLINLFYVSPSKQIKLFGNLDELIADEIKLITQYLRYEKVNPEVFSVLDAYQGVLQDFINYKHKLQKEANRPIGEFEYVIGTLPLECSICDSECNCPCENETHYTFAEGSHWPPSRDKYVCTICCEKCPNTTDSWEIPAVDNPNFAADEMPRLVKEFYEERQENRGHKLERIATDKKYGYIGKILPSELLEKFPNLEHVTSCISQFADDSFKFFQYEVKAEKYLGQNELATCYFLTFPYSNEANRTKEWVGKIYIEFKTDSTISLNHDMSLTRIFRGYKDELQALSDLDNHLIVWYSELLKEEK